MSIKFEKVCRVSDIPDNKRGRKFTLSNDTDIAVFKIDGKIYAVSNICPHNQSQVMYDGRVDEKLFLECPVHGWKFHLETGETAPECEAISSKLKTFQVQIDGDNLLVELKRRFSWFK